MEMRLGCDGENVGSIGALVGQGFLWGCLEMAIFWRGGFGVLLVNINPPLHFLFFL